MWKWTLILLLSPQNFVEIHAGMMPKYHLFRLIYLILWFDVLLITVCICYLLQYNQPSSTLILLVLRLTLKFFSVLRIYLSIGENQNFMNVRCHMTRRLCDKQRKCNFHAICPNWNCSAPSVMSNSLHWGYTQRLIKMSF